MPDPGSFAGADGFSSAGQARTRRQFLALAGGTPAPAADDYWIKVSRRAMACRFEITLASEDAPWILAARGALDEVDCIEAALTVFRESSVISHINRNAAAAPVTIDDRTFALLQECANLHEETERTFDVTSTPLSRCWGFLRRDGRLPGKEALETARACVGAQGVRLDAVHRTVRFDRSGMELNLGAIGKGYALDRVAGLLRRSGVGHALLSAGRSSLLGIGGRSGGWHVEVVSPRHDGRPLANLWLRDAALGTSGAGEQFVVVDGIHYGHVIDPRTGWPASGVLSASVIASTAARADALSTAFFIGGLQLAERYCARHSEVLALITAEGSRRPTIVGAHPGAWIELTGDFDRHEASA